MSEKEPAQLDYRKNDPPPKRAPWRFIRIVLILSAALLLTLMNLGRPRVSGWIGYLFPLTSLVFICFLLVAEIWACLVGEEPGQDQPDPTNADQKVGTVRHSYPAPRILRGSVFSGVQVGCVGATILIVFTVLCAFGLLAVVWWPYIHRLSNQ